MSASEAAAVGDASAERWVLQFSHAWYGPFADCNRQYAALFRARGWKVCTVYLTGAADEGIAAQSASDEVIFLEFSSAAVRGLKLAAMRALRRLLRGRDFALCIAHRQKPATIALLASRLPVIAVYHAFGNFRRRSHRLLAQHFRHRLLLLGVSDAVRDEIREALPGWPATRIETLYNRIDIAAVQAAQHSREDARAALQLPAQGWLVGNVGRLHPDKDQATLIRGFALALPELPADSQLVIIGSGRLEAALKALAVELGVVGQVVFVGQLAEARNYFAAFDVFVLSSDHEPFGMVLLEAMAAGVPVLSTDCGGAAEVVAEAAQRFPLGDAPALARRLVQWAKFPQAAAASAAQMRSRLSEHFSDEAAAARFHALPAVRELLA